MRHAHEENAPRSRRLTSIWIDDVQGPEEQGAPRRYRFDLVAPRTHKRQCSCGRCGAVLNGCGDVTWHLAACLQVLEVSSVKVVTSMTPPRTYTIREAAALTGLPASTLRYYEQVGVLPCAVRRESSGHRVYDDGDLDRLTAVACLAATGMSVADMREYVANNARGSAAVSDQIGLLQTQQEELTREAERLALRRRYVALKIAYWRAVEQGDQAAADDRAQQARALAGVLTTTARRSSASKSHPGLVPGEPTPVQATRAI